MGLEGIKILPNNFKIFNVGIIEIDFSSKNRKIPVNQSEEKWEKPHF